MRTVEGELIAALQTVLIGLAKKQNFTIETFPVLQGSGRTDAGVHARGQVASFLWPASLDFDAHKLRSSLNALTPREMAILSVSERPDDFDARFTPHQKCYAYRMLMRDVGAGLHRDRAWRVSSDLDVASMVRAARDFRGTHDFSSFRAKDCGAQTTERTILLSELTRVSSEELLFTVIGRGFMKQMIRIMVGTLVDIGRGQRTADDVVRLLALRNRELAGQTAPPDGLTMEWIRYSGDE